MKGYRRIIASYILTTIMICGCGSSARTENITIESQTMSETTEDALCASEKESITISETTLFEDFQEKNNTEGSIVIVLDPGHDDKECCTNSHPDLNMYEQDLNLTIGLACRERLLQYEGVDVYMTREDGACPDLEYGGDECIKARTDVSSKVDADIFVSLHCNGTTGVYGAETNGCEVYVSNYCAYTEECTKLGELIIQGLTALDIADGGVRVRTKEEKGFYDDGSVKDWYYLISNNVDAGYPAIIVEHAYMDNPHDNAILQDNENLKTMGRADADAIAAFYGLEEKD